MGTKMLKRFMAGGNVNVAPLGQTAPPPKNARPPGALVTVVEFSDFQCPYCKQESGVVRAQLMAAYPKDVQLFFMDYPLEASHPYARGAAILGRCIYRQNNSSFWAYHDWMFEHQSE